MAEYIDREAVCSDCKNQKVCVNKSVCPVGRAPAADVEVVKRGRWIAETERMGNYSHCSECGCRCRGYVPNYKYCPNCGCKMDLEATNGLDQH